jgi:hypothetical protein
MNSRTSAPYRRTQTHRSNGTPWLGAMVAIAFAAAPLVAMLWVVPVTGIGIA